METTLEEPISTSLGRLSEHDWQVLRNTWAKGIDWYVRKIGKRHWALLDVFGKFPLFTTKREAGNAGDKLICMESRHRSWLRQCAEEKKTPKFKVGDPVTMTNDNGVVFPNKTIKEIEQIDGEFRYYITPTDTPWFAVKESHLSLK